MNCGGGFHPQVLLRIQLLAVVYAMLQGKNWIGGKAEGTTLQLMDKSTLLMYFTKAAKQLSGQTAST